MTCQSSDNRNLMADPNRTLRSLIFTVSMPRAQKRSASLPPLTRKKIAPSAPPISKTTALRQPKTLKAVTESDDAGNGVTDTKQEISSRDVSSLLRQFDLEEVSCRLEAGEDGVHVGWMTVDGFHKLPSFRLEAVKVDLFIDDDLTVDGDTVGELKIVSLADYPQQSTKERVATIINAICDGPLRDVVEPGGSARTDIVGATKQLEADACWLESQELTPTPGVHPVDNTRIVLEVGRGQGWEGSAGLRKKMQSWFATVPAVCIVILIRINNDQTMEYEYHKRTVHNHKRVGGKAIRVAPIKTDPQGQPHPHTILSVDLKDVTAQAPTFVVPPAFLASHNPIRIDLSEIFSKVLSQTKRYPKFWSQKK